jgi:galactose mutarotase-like enzyme
MARFLRDGDAEVEIVPERGGMVVGFRVGDTPVLYLDRATLDDPTQKVRGGIPVLFPTAGRLAGDRYQGHELKQHGFARNLPWDVVAATPAELRLALSSSSATEREFPYAFRLVLDYALAGATLRITARCRNLDPRPLPLHFGLHPYFFVPDADKARTTIESRGDEGSAPAPFAGLDLTAPEIDRCFAAGAGPKTLRRPGASVTLAACPELSRWVVWTLAGRDFVCLEPWTAPANALNTGEGLIWIAPGQTRSLWVEISAG